jgi:GNAT superfamily N-acetyltransferase
MRTTVVILCAIALQLGCGASTPVWYEREPGKTLWTLPLIDPLADAELLVPVHVQDHGPYVFLLDPQAPTTVIDRAVAEDLRLYRKHYVRALNQRDKTVPSRVYEVLSLRSGELRVRNLDVISAPPGTLHAAGRRIDGVIGADLLSRTIVIDVDRDAGVVALVLTGHERIPEGASRVSAALHRGTLRVTGATGSRRSLNLIVELARRTTSLRRGILEGLGAELSPAEEEVFDYTGDRIVVSGRARLDDIALGRVGVGPAEVIPYEDRRGRNDIEYHGVVGQNVLSRYRLVVDRDHQRLWLAPRAATLAEGIERRLARWGEALARCEQPGCASLAFDPATRTLTISRDPSGPAALAITVAAYDDQGKRVAAPLLRAELTRGAAQTVLREPGIEAEYARATSFRVVDANPI